ncbi:DNA repair RadA-like protein [Nymphaea thermarum]|nr:DNA repair RadA-like protein [Nymphaea thermarum]
MGLNWQALLFMGAATTDNCPPVKGHPSSRWQALCLSGVAVARHVNGVKGSRADMIISAIFLNVVSGMKLTETAGHLALAAAICSSVFWKCADSFLEFPIPKNVAFIGEVGLGGELRTVARMDKRLNELIKLRFKKCVIPKVAEKSFKAIDTSGITTVTCSNLKETYSNDRNVSKILQVEEELLNLQQGDQSLAQYFASLKSIFERLKALRPPCPTCYKTHGEQSMVAKFLHGLSSEYAVAKAQMLTRAEIPDLADAYNRLSRLAVTLSSPSSDIHASALAAA